MIAIVRNIGIALMIAGFPLWVIWVAGGWVADRLGQRRAVAVLKGNDESL